MWVHDRQAVAAGADVNGSLTVQCARPRSLEQAAQLNPQAASAGSTGGWPCRDSVKPAECRSPPPPLVYDMIASLLVEVRPLLEPPAPPGGGGVVAGAGENEVAAVRKPDLMLSRAFHRIKDLLDADNSVNARHARPPSLDYTGCRCTLGCRDRHCYCRRNNSYKIGCSD